MHPYSHQSTSSSAKSPFRFAACLSMPSTHRPAPTRRKKDPRRRTRSDVTARDAYRGFGAGQLWKIADWRVELEPFTL